MNPVTVLQDHDLTGINHPVDPAEAISLSYLRGLASVRRLAANRVTKNTRQIFLSIDKQWKDAKNRWYESRKEGSYDFSIITSAEANIRKMYLRMIFEDSSKYGNTATIRIYDNLGDIDPLNSSLNIAGAILRDFSSIYYPFPKLTKIGNHLGYVHNKYGMIPVNHVNIPSLDFVDVIRAHVNEICKHLFIKKIQLRYTRKYVLRFLYASMPFLDWIYMGGKRGKNSKNAINKITRKFDNFTDIDKIMLKIIRDIKHDINFKNHTTTVTSINMADNSSLIEYLKKQGEGLGTSLQKQVNDNFYRLLATKIVTTRKRRGTIIHQNAMFGLPQPFSLNDVVQFGNKYIQIIDDDKKKRSKFIIVVELPIYDDTHSAKPDIVIFKKIGTHYGYFKPIAVLDIKTKHGFDWEVESRENSNGKFYAYPKIHPRKLTIDEWDNQVSHAYNGFVERQLENYETMLVEGYQEISSDFQPFKLIKGVVVLDGYQKIDGVTRGENKNVVQQLLYSFIHTIYDHVGDNRDNNEYFETSTTNELENMMENTHLVFRCEHNRVAIVTQQEKINLEGLVLESEDIEQHVPEYGPNHTNRLSLYISGASRVNFGNTAAWIAAHYHLIKKLQTGDDIFIIDMMECLKEFTHRRLRMDRTVDISKITILYPDEIDNYIELMKDKRVIISGWGDFRDINRGAYLNRKRILKKLVDCDTYLISDPAMDTRTSAIYKMRCLLPYRYPEKVSRIIWNLPVAPTKTRAPKYDNIRVILTHTSSGIIPEIIELKALRNLSKKFNQNRKRRSIGSSIPLKYLKEDEMLVSDAYDLVKDNLSEDSMIFTKIDYIHYQQLDRIEFDRPIKLADFEIKNKIDAQLLTRNRYIIKSKTTETSYLPPDLSQFNRDMLSTDRNITNRVFDYLLKKGNNELRKIIVKSDILREYSGGRETYNMVSKLENKIIISKMLIPFKYRFYMAYNHNEMEFDEFKARTIWLDLLIYHTMRNMFDVIDQQIFAVWQYCRSWLMYSLGYEYRGNSIFQSSTLTMQIKTRLSNSVKDVQIIPKIQGIMRTRNNYSHIKFDDEFQGMIKNIDEANGKEKLDKQIRENKYFKDDEAKIPVMIAQVGEFDYLYRYLIGWELIGRLKYYLTPNLQSFKIYPSIINLDMDVDVDNYEYLDFEINYLPCQVELDFIDEDHIGIYVSAENLLNHELVYDNVPDLLDALRAGRDANLDIVVDDRSVTVGWDRNQVRWGRLTVLRPLIYGHREQKYYGSMLKKLEKSIPDYIYELYYDSKEDIEYEINLTISHLDDKCPLREMDPEKIGKMDKFDLSYLHHGECWKLEGVEYFKSDNIFHSMDDLLLVFELHQKAFTARDVYEIYILEYVLIGNMKYHTIFDIDIEPDPTVMQEEWPTLFVLWYITGNYRLKKILPQSHIMEDVYSITDVEYANSEIWIYATSNKNGISRSFPIQTSISNKCKRLEILIAGLSHIMDEREYGELKFADDDLSIYLDDINEKLDKLRNRLNCDEDEKDCQRFLKVDFPVVTDHEQTEFKLVFTSLLGDGHNQIKVEKTFDLSEIESAIDGMLDTYNKAIRTMEKGETLYSDIVLYLVCGITSEFGDHFGSEYILCGSNALEYERAVKKFVWGCLMLFEWDDDEEFDEKFEQFSSLVDRLSEVSEMNLFRIDDELL